MKTPGNPRVTATWIALFLSSLPSLSCDLLEPEFEDLRMRNRTEVSVLAFPWDLETTHLLDISPSVELGSDGGFLLAPGASVRLQPEDVQGEYRDGRGIRIFVYEVVGEVGEYCGTETRTGRELGERDYRITIRSC